MSFKMKGDSTKYKNTPIITDFWLSATVGVSVLAHFGILPPQHLILHEMQFWQPLTALFYYPLSPQKSGLNFLLNVYLLYTCSHSLESEIYESQKTYFLLLVFNWICCVISALFLKIFVLMDIMVLSVLYVWCQSNKENWSSLPVGEFKLLLCCLVLGVKWIISGKALDSVLGIIIGYLYFKLVSILGIRTFQLFCLPCIVALILSYLVV